MTKDRARKQGIRARMADTGEPYSVAARQLAGFESAEGSLAARVAARASGTLNEPSARMGVHLVIELPGVETPETPREQRRSGVLGVARRLLGTFLHGGTHVDGEGFAEPAARRYLIDGGPGPAGSGYLCREGKVVMGRHGWRARLPRQELDMVTSMHWLWPLWALAGTTTARAVGPEEVRGTTCQQLIAEVDLSRALEAGGPGWPAAFRPGPHVPMTATLAVWVDERHVRRVRLLQGAHGEVSLDPPKRLVTLEVELWDFGVSVAQLDWSRLP